MGTDKEMTGTMDKRNTDTILTMSICLERPWFGNSEWLIYTRAADSGMKNALKSVLHFN